jgi:hypothetical protein
MTNNITSTEHYQNILNRIWELMQLPHPTNSPEYAELNMLVSMAEDYEDNILKVFGVNMTLVKN